MLLNQVRVGFIRKSIFTVALYLNQSRGHVTQIYFPIHVASYMHMYEVSKNADKEKIKRMLTWTVDSSIEPHSRN